MCACMWTVECTRKTFLNIHSTWFVMGVWLFSVFYFIYIFLLSVEYRCGARVYGNFFHHGIADLIVDPCLVKHKLNLYIERNIRGKYHTGRRVKTPTRTRVRPSQIINNLLLCCLGNHWMAVYVVSWSEHSSSMECLLFLKHKKRGTWIAQLQQEQQNTCTNFCPN